MTNDEVRIKIIKMIIKLNQKKFTRIGQMLFKKSKI